MKRIFLFLMLLASTGTLQAQSSAVFQKARILDSLRLGDQNIRGFSRDVAMADSADNLIPTQSAIRGAIVGLNNLLNARISSITPATIGAAPAEGGSGYVQNSEYEQFATFTIWGPGRFRAGMYSNRIFVDNPLNTPSSLWELFSPERNAIRFKNSNNGQQVEFKTANTGGILDFPATIISSYQYDGLMGENGPLGPIILNPYTDLESAGIPFVGIGTMRPYAPLTISDGTNGTALHLQANTGSGVAGITASSGEMSGPATLALGGNQVQISAYSTNPTQTGIQFNGGIGYGGTAIIGSGHIGNAEVSSNVFILIITHTVPGIIIPHPGSAGPGRTIRIVNFTNSPIPINHPFIYRSDGLTQSSIQQNSIVEITAASGNWYQTN